MQKVECESQIEELEVCNYGSNAHETKWSTISGSGLSAWSCKWQQIEDMKGIGIYHREC